MADPIIMQVTDEQLRRIVKEEVQDAFVAVGLDPSKPLKSQKNMAFLSSLRRIWTEGGMKALLTIVGLVCTACFLAMLIGLGVGPKVMTFFGLHG